MGKKKKSYTYLVSYVYNKDEEQIFSSDVIKSSIKLTNKLGYKHFFSYLEEKAGTDSLAILNIKRLKK